jgi:Na+-transporting methylmalonyl-CoA/oxaloacetate decarboxylase gamma subunit
VGSNLLVHGLAFLTLVFLSFFIIMRVMSKHKHRAVGEPMRHRFSATDSRKQPTAERLDLNLPVICRTPLGNLEATLTQLSVGGGFVACAQPLAVGERFEISLAVSAEKSLALRAEVLWNNSHVSAENIITRGMKIRFLQLSAEGRQLIQTIFQEHAKAGKIPAV